MAVVIPLGSESFAGVIIINVFSMLSAFTLVTVMLRMIWLSVRYKLDRKGARPSEYAFFTTHIGCYAACLLIANTFSALGGLLDLRWLIMRAVEDGFVCKVQVAILQLGNWSSAYFTVAIALHAFSSLVLRVRQSALICGVTISVGWLAAITAASAPVAVKYSMYGPTGVTCSFGPAHLTAKFLLHVLPILLGSLLSAGLCSVAFLILRGSMSIKGGIKFVVDPTERWTVSTDPESYQRFVAKIARTMLWFPIGYGALMVPYSVVQLMTISGHNVPLGVLVLSLVLWFLLGTVNVLLTYNVFRALGPAINPASTSRRTDLLPTHHNSQPVAGQGRTPSLHVSIISAKTTMSQYSTLIQSSIATHQEDLDLSAAVPEALTPLDRHIIPRGTKLDSPDAHLEHDAAEMQGVPPPFRPLRTDPLVTGASGSAGSLRLNKASDTSPRGYHAALSAIMGTAPSEELQADTPDGIVISIRGQDQPQ